MVTAHRGDTGIHIHVVVHGQIVEIFRGNGDVFLTDQGVDEALDIGTIVVVLLGDKGGGIDPVHPGGDIRHIIVGVFPSAGVEQHRTDDIRAAKQADGAGLTRADPPGLAVLVQFQMGRAEHKGRIAEAQGAQ